MDNATIALVIMFVVILIVTTVMLSNSNTKLIENNVIIHSDCDPGDMKMPIIKVHHVYEAIIGIMDRVLPITIKFSHWEVVIELGNGHMYMVSSAHQGFVEVFKAEYNTDARIYSYTWKRGTNKCYKLNTYDVNIDIDIITYAHHLNMFIHKAQSYDLLHNNCMHATSYGIVHILDIGYRPELDVDTNLTRIAKSIYDNFMNYKER